MISVCLFVLFQQIEKIEMRFNENYLEFFFSPFPFFCCLVSDGSITQFFRLLMSSRVETAVLYRDEISPPSDLVSDKTEFNKMWCLKIKTFDSVFRSCCYGDEKLLMNYVSSSMLVKYLFTLSNINAILQQANEINSKIERFTISTKKVRNDDFQMRNSKMGIMG